MENEYISYELAVMLKELGFIEPTIFAYDRIQFACTHVKTPFEPLNYNALSGGDYVSAPLFGQVFRWFRNEHKLFGEIFIDDDGTFGYCISRPFEGGMAISPINRKFLKHEFAESCCVSNIINIIKERKEK